MLIYVVDDHELMRDATVILVRHVYKDADIKEFSSFESFLAGVSDFGSPQLLILDLTLPRIIGYEGVRTARQKCPDARIAIYSASPSDDRASECLSSGADIYIEKSKDAASFKHALQKLVD